MDRIPGKRTGACHLSVVVLVHDMPRAAPRTLTSLSAAYQRGVDPSSYEVIVVENGSSEPLGTGLIEGMGDNFRHVVLEDPPASPAHGMNAGVRLARGDALGLMIDGARLVTPGMLRWALDALAAFERAVVTTLSFHIGRESQTRAARRIWRRYDRAREDKLLKQIGWPRDGYRLFEIAALAGSSVHGWFRPVTESNCLFMPRALFDELNGFDERFDLPGGGLLNLDFYRRACDLPESSLVMLLGEGSFHQIHGGIMTNSPPRTNLRRWRRYAAQYEALKGEAFRPPTRRPILFGAVPGPALPWVLESCARLRTSRPARR